jgi:tetratricopeptide (TPR) repeat protein
MTVDNKQYRWKKWIWVSTGVLFIALCAGSYMYWQSKDQSSGHTNAAADNAAYNDVRTTANNLIQENLSTLAAIRLTDYANNSPNRVHKSDAYLYAASIYMGEQNYAQALSMCKKAQAANGITYTEAQEAGTAAQKLGENSVAIFYYKAAIKLIPPSFASPQTQKDTYNQAIQQLQSKS